LPKALCTHGECVTPASRAGSHKVACVYDLTIETKQLTLL
jgi:hypothetical protein